MWTLYELFSPRNCEKFAHNPLLNFSVPAKVDQIASVNVFTTHYLANGSHNSARLVSLRCEWTLNICVCINIEFWHRHCTLFMFWLLLGEARSLEAGSVVSKDLSFFFINTYRGRLTFESLLKRFTNWTLIEKIDRLFRQLSDLADIY